MNNTFHGLQLAIDLAERQRDERAQVLARAQRQVQMGYQQLEQLQSYAKDTDARWVQSQHTALSPELLRHHYQFVDRLQHAMGMQDGVIANLARQESQCRAALMQAEMRLSGLKQVLEKRQLSLAAAEQRREQVQMDEMAAMVHARRMAATQLEETR